MNTDSWAGVIATHWPWLIPIVVLAFLAYKALPIIRDGWVKLLAYLGRIGSRERDRIDVELSDLRRQVTYLNTVVGDLRNRDEMNWAWILTDQEYHRTIEYMAVSNSWPIPPHISFMEFRDKWLKDHKNPKPPTP